MGVSGDPIPLSKLAFRGNASALRTDIRRASREVVVTFWTAVRHADSSRKAAERDRSDGSQNKRSRLPREAAVGATHLELPLAGPRPGRCQISCVGCTCRKPRRTHAISGAAPSYSQTYSLDHLLREGPRPAVAASVPRRRRTLAPGPSPEAHRPDSSHPAPLPNDRARSSQFYGAFGSGSHAVQTPLPCDASVSSFRRATQDRLHRKHAFFRSDHDPTPSHGTHNTRPWRKPGLSLGLACAFVDRNLLHPGAQVSSDSNAPFSACSSRYFWNSPVL